MTCPHVPKFRRDACRSCYRKLGASGLPVGPDGRAAAYLRKVAAGARTDSGRLSVAPGGPSSTADAERSRARTAREKLEAVLAKARGE